MKGILRNDSKVREREHAILLYKFKNFSIKKEISKRK